MAHNVLSYGSPEAARRANRAINKIAQDGGFVGVKPTERRTHTAVASNSNGVVSDSTYDGMFKITVADNKLQVVYHGSSAISNGVGTLHINGVTFVIPFGEPVEVVHTTYVYLDVASRKILLLLENQTAPPYSVLIGKYDYITKEITQVLKTHTGYTFDGYSGSFTMCIQDGRVCINSFLGMAEGASTIAGVFNVNNISYTVPTYTGELPTTTTHYYIQHTVIPGIPSYAYEDSLTTQTLELLRTERDEVYSEWRILQYETIPSMEAEATRRYDLVLKSQANIDSIYANYYASSKSNIDYYNNIILGIQEFINSLDKDAPDYEEVLNKNEKRIRELEDERDSKEEELRNTLKTNLLVAKENFESSLSSYQSYVGSISSYYSDRANKYKKLTDIDLILYGGIANGSTECSIVASTTTLASNNINTYCHIGSISFVADVGYVISQDLSSKYTVYRVRNC